MTLDDYPVTPGRVTPSRISRQGVTGQASNGEMPIAIGKNSLALLRLCEK
jgi:hypothetical protein